MTVRGVMGWVVGSLGAASIAVLAAPVGAAEPDPLPPHVEGRVIVVHTDEASRAERMALSARDGVESVRSLMPTDPRIVLVELDDSTTVEEAIERLSADPTVASVEVDAIIERMALPDDHSWVNGDLWGMQGSSSTPANAFGSGAAEAWADGHVGSRSVAVGVVDDGPQTGHPDLVDNIWTNPFDPVDGVDNDGNGYVDDVHGWDFYDNDATVFDRGSEDYHGTHVAGSIGATGDNEAAAPGGVVGVNWQVTVIPAVIFDGNTTSESTTIAAIGYLTDLATRHPSLNLVAANHSWGGPTFRSALLAALNASGDAGLLHIAAAGNSASDLGTSSAYPAEYVCNSGGARSWDCVVSVASIDSAGALSTFSNFGDVEVDLGAPGTAIISTYPPFGYKVSSGTSMATPHVTGAVALCASVAPAADAEQLRTLLLGSVEATTSLAGKTVTGGRLDVAAMIDDCATGGTVTGAPTGVTTSTLSEGRIGVSWTDAVTGEAAYDVQVAPRAGSQCGVYRTVLSTVASPATVSGLTPSLSHCVRVRGVSSTSSGPFSSVAVTTSGSRSTQWRCAAVPIAPTDMTGGTTHFSAPFDDAVTTVTLPFSFDFDGAARTSLTVSTNGVTSFSTLTTSERTGDLGTPTGPDGVIAALWRDLEGDVDSGASVRSRTVGTAPNRTFVVEWNTVRAFGGTGLYTVQVALAETTDTIEFRYIDVTEPTATVNDRAGTAATGFESMDGSFGVVVSAIAPISDGSAVRCGLSAAPSAPRSVAATPGNRSAVVRWAAPTSTGLVPLRGYVVTSRPAGAGCATGGATTCTVRGLRNGTAYTFDVVAVTDDGASTTRSRSITPRTRPDAPRSVEGTSRDKAVVLRWKAPRSNGGAAITRYTVTASPGDRTCSTRGALTCTVTKLRNGTPYRFKVVAHNVAGVGPAGSTPRAVTPRAR